MRNAIGTGTTRCAKRMTGCMLWGTQAHATILMPNPNIYSLNVIIIGGRREAEQKSKTGINQMHSSLYCSKYMHLYSYSLHLPLNTVISFELIWANVKIVFKWIRYEMCKLDHVKNSPFQFKNEKKQTHTSGHTAHKLLSFSWLLLLVLYGPDLISIAARLCSFQKANTEHRATNDRNVFVLDLINLVQSK